ncbi:hypothetical protein OF83DRAFT_1099496 [Amylostereum chailletii]|nr:hypothetical protein OF83DRAFT_1099496 [Amylostereum chailletii]
MEVDDSVDVDVAMASPCPEIWEDSDMAAGTGFEKVDNEAVISPVLESERESVRRETRAERRDRRQEERCRQEADRIVRRNGYDFDAALKKAKDNPSHADPWCIPYSLRQRPAHKLPYRPPPPDDWPLKGPYLRREINRDCPVLNAVQFEDPFEGKLSEEEFEALFEDAEDEEEPAAVTPDSDDESTSSELSSVLIVMNIGSPEIVESNMVSVEVQQPAPSPMQVVIQDIVSPVLGFLDATSAALHGLGLLNLFDGSF